MTTPTPSSRAHACVLASLLAVAAALPASAAVTGWREVQGTFNKTVHRFFYPLEERGKPVVTNEGGHATIRLYKKTVVSNSEKARSHLFSTDGGKTYRLHLIAEDGPERDLSKGMTYTSKDVAAQPTQPAPPAADAAPEGVDADVWAEVNAKYGAGLSADDKALLGKVLTHVKKNNPDKYAGVQAWLQKDPKAHASKVAQAAKARGVPAAAAELLEWASAGAPTGAGPATGAPASGAPSSGRADPPAVGEGKPVGQDGGPPERLQRGMKHEDRWPDVAARIIAWSWPENARGSFITPEARKNPLTKAAYESAMKEAVKETANWGAAVNVYYILGPGEPVPAWVTGDPALKELLVDAQVRIKEEKLVEVLEQCLDKWRHGAKGSRPEKCDKTPDANQVRVPYPGGKNELPKWPNHFLKDAGHEATVLLQSIRVGKDPISETINNSAGTVPDATGGSGQRQTRLPAMPSTSFGMDHLFGKWGDPNVFHLDGRLISINLRTRQTFEGDPPRAVLRQELGIYDISNAAEVYGRRLDIQSSGEKTFDLKPGGKSYKISFVPDGSDVKIQVTRPDGTAPTFGSGATAPPTLNQMYQNRANQALASGNRVKVGDKFYRVTGESASTGNLLFWDEAELQRSQSLITSGFAGSTARDWVPSMMAAVVTSIDGRAQPISNAVPLGKQVGGEWQGLRWNEGQGIWIPAQGEEFKPKVPAAPSTGTPATPPGGGQQPPGNPTTPTTPGTPGGPAPTPAAAEATVARLNSELGPEAAKRVVFFVPDGLAFGRHLGVARRGEDGKPIQGKMSLVMFPGLGDGGTNLREAIHKGRYLVTSTDKGLQVDDMLKYDFVDGKIYGTVGATLSKDKVVKDVTDREALALVLAAAGFQASEAQIMANHAKAVGNVTQWTVVGYDSRHEKPHLNVLLGTSKCVRIHPKYDPAGCTGDESVTATVPGVGQGMALDSVGGATQVGDTAFYDSTEIGTAKVTRVEPKAARAGLYLAVDGEKKNWYLTFLIKPKEGGEYKRTHIAFRNAASEAVGVQVEAPPSGLQIGGVTLKGALVETAMKASASDSGDLSKAGFIGAYTGSNGACVGVVAWWGVDLKTACDRCGAKMAGNACVEK